jgi:hypothetical protein
MCISERKAATYTPEEDGADGAGKETNDARIEQPLGVKAHKAACGQRGMLVQQLSL